MIAILCLPDPFVVFCGSPSWCLGFVCSVIVVFPVFCSFEKITCIDTTHTWSIREIQMYLCTLDIHGVIKKFSPDMLGEIH